MSVARTLLTIGASLGVGAATVPMFGGVLSKPITGEVVPTRITDLAGYLTASGEKGLGVADITDAFGLTVDGQDPDSGQSVGTVDNSGAPATAPTVSVPRTGGVAPNPKAGPAPTATADKKRALAVASFGAGLSIAFGTFLLIRRVMGP